MNDPASSVASSFTKSVDIAIITSCVVFALQLAPLLLGRKRIQRVDDLLESFTVFVDDVRPLKWLADYAPWKRVSAHASVAGLLIFLTAAYSRPAFIDWPSAEFDGRSESDKLLYAIFMLGLSLGFLLLSLAVPLRIIARYNAGEKDVGSFTTTIGLVALICLGYSAYYCVTSIDALLRYWVEGSVPLRYYPDADAPFPGGKGAVRSIMGIERFDNLPVTLIACGAVLFVGYAGPFICATVSLAVLSLVCNVSELFLSIFRYFMWKVVDASNSVSLTINGIVTATLSLLRAVLSALGN